jgi:hypothetical protein
MSTRGSFTNRLRATGSAVAVGQKTMWRGVIVGVITGVEVGVGRGASACRGGENVAAINPMSANILKATTAVARRRRSEFLSILFTSQPTLIRSSYQTRCRANE